MYQEDIPELTDVMRCCRRWTLPNASPARASLLSVSIIALLGISVLAGCNFRTAPPAQVSPSAVPSAPSGLQTGPQIGITIPAASDLTRVADAATVLAGAPLNGSPNATLTPTPAVFVPFIDYSADVTLDLNTHLLSGSLVTLYRNVTAAPLNEIVYRIIPSETRDQFSLQAVSTDSSVDTSTFNGSRLTVILHTPLAVGDSLTIHIAFTLRLSALATSGTKNGYLGYSERQTNLGDWLPAVAPNIDGNWLFPAPWPTVGETTVTESARYEVTLRLHGTNASQQIVAGPGIVTQIDPTTWHFVLDHGRNFTLSISHDFIVRQTTTDSGVTVVLYTFGEATTPVFDFALQTARDALTRDAQWFGPCPYKRVVIVEGDFPDGMEFSGMVFISGYWFETYPNKPESWLMLITVHELAHQWWYSSVGDDQSRTPFLDETFAVYSELLFVEQVYPGQDAWWWNFRIRAFQPQGYVDSTVYDFGTQRPYINAVYLRGALFLDEIRGAIGDEAFMTWLRTYARTQADRIATPAALWGLLSAEDYARIAPIRARYLRIPDPLDNPTATSAATQDSPPASAIPRTTTPHP